MEYDLRGSAGEKVKAGCEIVRINIQPKVYHLSQNHPNPFNARTVIRYMLPEAGFVRLTIYDLLGREVRCLTDGMQRMGYHSVVWDGQDEKGREVSSGLYLYRLAVEPAGETDESVIRTRKMMMLR